MLKKIYKALVSTYTMAFLFVLFSVAMAVATFIENDFGTETARTLIYDAWWFELIMVLGLINLIGNIIRYRLYTKEKWHSFIFHLAFIFILLGAAVTRYIGYEGQMPIIEGETVDYILSEKNYIVVRVDDGKEQLGPLYKRIKLSALGKNRFHFNFDFKGTPVSLELTDFVPHATKQFRFDNTKPKHLKLVESTQGKRNTIYIPEGKGVNLNNKFVSFNDSLQGGIRIYETGGGALKIKSAFPGMYQIMKTGEQGMVQPDSTMDFHTGALYIFDNLSFVVPSLPEPGEVILVPGKASEHPWNYLKFKLKAGNQSKEIELFGGQYYTGNPLITSLNGYNFVISYGPLKIGLPFKIKLRDFEIKYYPGTHSPKSYASEITVIDKDTTFDYRIYMNHVLDYKKYRFFQSSYAITPEYEQTILSVNHDFWGTWITYFGYALLYFGLIMIFVNPHSLYNHIRRHLDYILKKKEKLGLSVLIFLAFSYQVQAQHEGLQTGKIAYKKMIPPTVVPDTLAERFGMLVIQDNRMKPVNTYASELLRKLSKHDTWKIPDTTQKLSANQVLFSMMIAPELWAYVPVIYLERGDEKVRQIIGLDKKTKYARLADFFDDEGNYKLANYVDQASKTRIKNKFQKDVENIDQRVNLLYGTLTGMNLKLFPKPGDPQHKWYSPTQLNGAGFNEKDSLFVAGIIPLIRQAMHEKDYKAVSEYLKGIDVYQHTFGKDVYPDVKKLKWEVFYNKHDAFRSMFWKLMLLSLVILTAAIAQIIRKRKIWHYILVLSKILVLYLALEMIFFLGLRWYISGHAPWSNAYESMIYVSLATLLATLWYGRKSDLALGAGSFITSILLMVAHWNWMDPAIGNLVPVLDSYWLMIHVAVIVASYGPFMLSAILAFLTLMFILFTNKRNKPKFELIVKELTDINKLSLIVGLVLLTIGNFLGGQWANESWGRYWGWDPKETWALISIMTYALVIHSRMVPALRGLFKFNVMSLFAVGVIMMTYFGVNFYLSGLHSYAKGEPVKTPGWIYMTVLLLILLSFASYFKYRKHYREQT